MLDENNTLLMRWLRARGAAGESKTTSAVALALEWYSMAPSEGCRILDLLYVATKY